MNAKQTEQIVNQVICEGLAPDPEMTISEWADTYRRLPSKSSSESGPWRTARTPYLKEIMDCLCPSNPCTKVIFMKGSQIGGTECGLNWLGYIIHLSPGPTLLIEPTVDLGGRLSKQRIQPMIDECPVLQGLVKEAGSRESSNTIASKDFKGGVLVIAGSNSAAGYRQMSARFLFCDEVDGYVSDVEGEGDPLALAEKRTSTYEKRKKIFLVSTPNIKDFSRIEREYLLSDQRHYHLPCPHCGEFQWLQWSGVIWEHSEPHKPIFESVAYKCKACGQKIGEFNKTWMLEHGKWIPDNPDSKTPGFFLNSLYSPLGWKSWRSILEEFYESKGVVEKLKTWTNTVLGQTWEGSSEKVDPDPLLSARESYNKVPEGCYVLTAGVDVQKNRLEVEVVAWGLGEESWSISYKVFDGDTTQDLVWSDLDEYLSIPFEHENGDKLKILCTAIDSGDNTKKVYEFIKPRQGRWIRAIKGVSKSDQSFLWAKKDIRGVMLYTIAVDKIKETFYAYLRQKICHFPIHPQYDQDHFKQLTAEKITTRYVKGFPVREWVKTYERNEALDCRVYAMAALLIKGVNLKMFANKWAKEHGQEMPIKIEHKPKPEQPKPTMDQFGIKIVTGEGLYRVRMIKSIQWGKLGKMVVLEKGEEYSVTLKEVKKLTGLNACNVLDELPGVLPSPQTTINPFARKKHPHKNWVNNY